MKRNSGFGVVRKLPSKRVKLTICFVTPLARLPLNLVSYLMMKYVVPTLIPILKITFNWTLTLASCTTLHTHLSHTLTQLKSTHLPLK